ncbi:MAG: HDOD domain-containing protein [Thermodesulfobacteriota bacterium]|nr:MAG: HDOD domain-containing protein [Thermodesulfobacteriota bacterium]
MKIECPDCRKAYKISDDKIPFGKKFAVSCLACKKRIVIDLRSEAKPNKPPQPPKPEKKAQTAKPVPEPSFGKKQPSGIKLKYGILRTLDDLPAMPHIVQKAQGIMSRPDSNIKELARVIELEQAIATRVLKLANSAYYGLSGKVSSVQHASVLLGYKALGDMISIAGISNLMSKDLKGYQLDSGDLWRHSIAVAFGSRNIANRKNTEFGSVAFFAGLIHDAGKLILDPYVYERKDSFDEFMADGENTFVNAEKAILGFDHSEIASELCQKWKIPNDQRIAIRFHHNPSRSDGNELAFILHMADYIAMANGYGTGTDGAQYQAEDGVMDFIDLREEDVEHIKKDVQESVEKISEEVYAD